MGRQCHRPAPPGSATPIARRWDQVEAVSWDIPGTQALHFSRMEQRPLVFLLRLAGVSDDCGLSGDAPPYRLDGRHASLARARRFCPARRSSSTSTRSIAALYGFHGVLLLVVARDPVRHRPIVRYLGVMNVVFGVLLILIDVHAGLPTIWTLAEGPPIVAMGAVVLYLSRRDA